ncbi:MAG TPA: MarR family transcriptional regulator [Pseudonocardia sp.]|nr:MarR family transcriptional regulator [Pseudonocardia sp.]
MDPRAEPLERLLVRAGQALQRRARAAAAGHGLSATALEVLGVLVAQDAPSQRDLAGHLRLSPATLTPVLDALEAAGALVRTRDGADRRVVRIAVTAAGRERAAAAATGGHGVGFEPSPQEAAVVRAYLVRLLDFLEDVDP